MRITDVPFAFLRFQYQFVRYPLQLIEDQVIVRMDSEAPGRLLYERSFGTLDATVGSVLGDSELARRGSAFVERSEALGWAARLDRAATRKKMHADERLAAKRDQAVKDREKARATRQHEDDDARAALDKRKRAAVVEGQNKATDGKKRAEEVAARRTASILVNKREKQFKVREAEQAAAAAAGAELSDAQQKRRGASDMRSRADRLEKLADLEKQKGRNARPSDG
jgi:hypothetical protein